MSEALRPTIRTVTPPWWRDWKVLLGAALAAAAGGIWLADRR